ncbi:MAG: hypothetical protein EXS16_05055 [Gemmataceae bacterium]|nr:hypothetical protein [Gemmataceae bacterium]
MLNVNSNDALQLLAELSAPRSSARPSDLAERVAFLERELERTQDLLRLALTSLVNPQDISSKLQDHCKRFISEPAALPSGLHERAEAIMLKVKMLLSKGDDIQALRFYRQETGAVWDEIHDTIAMWNMDYHQTLARVVIHLRHRRFKDSLDIEEPQA